MEGDTTHEPYPPVVHVDSSVFLAVDRPNIKYHFFLEQIEVLKSQLNNAGIKPLSEMVTYETAKEYLTKALKNASESDSYENIKEVERWDEFIKNHPKYIEEEKEKEEAWKNDNFLKNEFILLVSKAKLTVTNAFFTSTR